MHEFMLLNEIYANAIHANARQWNRLATYFDRYGEEDDVLW